MQNRSKHEKITIILDEKLQNLEPAFREELYNHLHNTELWSNIEKASTYMRNQFNLKHNRRILKRYWTDRGWNKEYAEQQVLHYKKKFNTLSPFTKEFWLHKINEKTGEKYTIVEANYKRNSIRPIRKEYWIEKGYSTNEATQLAIQTKHNNNITGAKASKNLSPEKQREYSCRCKEFWITQGYTESEAKEKIYEIQTKTWKNYNDAERQQRINKWLTTLANKPKAEIERINKAKLSKGISVSKNERYLYNTLSNEFDQVISQFTLHESNKKRYVYDICKDKKIIEYNGDFWHINPEIYNKDFVNKRTKLTASETHIRDAKKINYAIQQGYEVLVIWENDFKHNKEETINKCRHFMME